MTVPANTSLSSRTEWHSFRFPLIFKGQLGLSVVYRGRCRA